MDETHKAGAGSAAKQMCCQEGCQMLDEENCSDCIFLNFFLSKPHFENSSLVCHVTVDHQIPVTACHLFLFILASKEHERSSADIKKKKLTCGLG